MADLGTIGRDGDKASEGVVTPRSGSLYSAPAIGTMYPATTGEVVASPSKPHATRVTVMAARTNVVVLSE